jgi:hypothetical protein
VVVVEVVAVVSVAERWLMQTYLLVIRIIRIIGVLGSWVIRVMRVIMVIRRA